MTRLLARTSALMLFFTVAILIARLVGSARPKPALFSVLFTNPDGSPCERPCMFGVRPGKITVDEAVAMLKQHPFTREMEHSKSSSDFRFRGQGIVVMIAKNGDWIGLDVDFIESESTSRQLMEMASLGTVIATFGIPDVVAVSGREVSTSFFGTQLNFNHYRNLNEHVSVDARLHTIFVQNSPMSQRDLDANAFRSWRGFSLAARYYD